MSAYNPSQVFATINSLTPMKPVKKCHSSKDGKAGLAVDNEIHVTATGEVTVPPDHCRVTVSVSSTKDQVEDVKKSVSRRVDYITQTLASHQIRDEDVATAKVLRRVDGLFHFNVEITITFADSNKCLSITNFLVEKLDGSVRVTSPEFFHGPQRLENARRQASLSAVKNARLKAVEIGQYVHAKVGAPLSVREDSSNEWYGPAEGPLELDGPLTVHQRIEQATFHASARVSAVFLLSPKRTKEDKN